MKEIYTIGYGNRPIEDFLELLQRHGIGLVADVRRFPTSKREEFQKERLSEILKNRGIRYLHIEGLGGYRGSYRSYTRTKHFREALQKLSKKAQEFRTAIMCLEEDPRGCHRKYIAEALRRKGWRVYHILRDGSVTTSLRPKQR